MANASSTAATSSAASSGGAEANGFADPAAARSSVTSSKVW